MINKKKEYENNLSDKLFKSKLCDNVKNTIVLILKK